MQKVLLVPHNFSNLEVVSSGESDHLKHRTETIDLMKSTRVECEYWIPDYLKIASGAGWYSYA